MTSPKWGIVATIKAPTKDVLEFVAYHLDLGATEIAVFLDDCNADTAQALSEHPQVRVILTDEDHWQNTIGRRPKKHQVRQVRNASYYYRRAQHLDWIAHIDVDEFLCPETSVAEVLSACPKDTPALRVFPAESLCSDGLTDVDPEVTYCKARLPDGTAGKALEHVLYPNFGGALRSGFVSHIIGKVFVRTGFKNVKFGIHRAFENRDDELSKIDAQGMELCHRHIQSWDKWLQIIEFRLSQGSYRAELEQSLNPLSGRIQRHRFFTSLMEGDTTALRAFFEESCLATPELRGKLAETGYLRSYTLGLEQKRKKHIPHVS